MINRNKLFRIQKEGIQKEVVRDEGTKKVESHSEEHVVGVLRLEGRDQEAPHLFSGGRRGAVPRSPLSAHLIPGVSFWLCCWPDAFTCWCY